MTRQLTCALLILLCVSLGRAQDAKDKKEEKSTPPNYYPLQAGNEWHYQVTANNQAAKVTTRIAKVETIDGTPMARLETSSGPINEHLIQNDKGVFRTRFNGAEISPPFQVIPYPVKLGAKWKGNFTVLGEKGKHDYVGEIGPKEEMVTVPAGKFQAIRVRLTLEENGQQSDSTFWFAKNIGIVKQEVSAPGAMFTLELEKFESKKKENAK
ncbi:MAG TPA: hypothetical protein VFE62_19850 [Gemmataceae bacterium]|nr:hypothetical protein [Gemmataceae bacterium]